MDWASIFTWQYTQWVYGPRLDALLYTIHTTVNTAYTLR